MPSTLPKIIPVLPSSNIQHDAAWYKEKLGFDTWFADSMYAILYRGELVIHLQWHAGTDSDPLLGGSVIRIYVKDIRPLFEEYIQRGVITPDRLKTNTPWNTNEFGLHDPNGNAIFVMEDSL